MQDLICAQSCEPKVLSLSIALWSDYSDRQEHFPKIFLSVLQRVTTVTTVTMHRLFLSAVRTVLEYSNLLKIEQILVLKWFSTQIFEY
jgi:hypothetical protein